MTVSSSFSLHARSKFSAKLSASVLSLGLGVPGLIFACIVLCAYGYAAWHPVSRRHMNRVSLRLLAYALVANLIFGIANIIQNTVQSSSAYPSGWCGYLVWMTQLSLIFSAAMFFIMALNLQLVLVHHLNGQRMERYYIIGATAFTLASTVPPYAAGQFGWSENARSCWYCNPDPEKVKQWILGTDTAPMITLAVGELIAFMMILGHFVSYELFWRQTRVDSDGTYFEDIPTPRSPIVMYKHIILRIGLYPLVSCLINIPASILDIRVTISPDFTYAEGLADTGLLSCRILVYSLLALADPSFIRAIQEIRHSRIPDSDERFAAFRAAELAIPVGGRMHQGDNGADDAESPLGDMHFQLSKLERGKHIEGRDRDGAIEDELEFTRQI